MAWRSKRLFEYAVDGDINSLERLIFKQGRKADRRDWSGATPLHYACGSGELLTVQWLIEKAFCNPSITDKEGWNALHYSSHNGNLHIIKYLLENATIKLDVEAFTIAGQNALTLAVARGCLTCVKYLVQVGNCRPNSRSEGGWCALTWAKIYKRGWKNQTNNNARSGEIEKYLLSTGSFSTHDLMKERAFDMIEKKKDNVKNVVLPERTQLSTKKTIISSILSTTDSINNIDVEILDTKIDNNSSIVSTNHIPTINSIISSDCSSSNFSYSNSGSFQKSNKGSKHNNKHNEHKKYNH